MEIHFLQTVSFSSLIHDAVVGVGIGAALLAGLVFISLGLLLPGLLTSLGGHHGNSPGGYVEFGPAAAPIISEPAPRRDPSPETSLEPQHVTRPHLWQRLSGSAGSHPTRPMLAEKR